MDLLESLEVVPLTWLVGDSPDSEIVHVGHVLPRMLELRSLSNELILELVLSYISVRSDELSESLESSLGVVKPVRHLYLFLL